MGKLTDVQAEKVGDTYKGRRTINSGSEVDGGVYVVDNRQEAIVVDFDTYKDAADPGLDDLYRRALDRYREMREESTGIDEDEQQVWNQLSFRSDVDEQQVPGKENVLDGKLMARAVYGVVEEEMDYDTNAVEDDKIGYVDLKYLQTATTRIQQPGGGSTEPDEVDVDKLDLQSVYIQEDEDPGEAVCRHMGLAAAAILERMHKNGLIQGTGVIHQEINYDPQTGEPAGHLWAEYVELSDDDRASVDRTIVDPAQHYCGDPSDDPTRKRWYSGPDADKDVLPELLLRERSEEQTYESDIDTAQSFAELKQIVQDHGGVEGSKDRHDTDELLEVIDAAQAIAEDADVSPDEYSAFQAEYLIEEHDLRGITRAAGLRDKVEELLEEHGKSVDRRTKRIQD